MVGGQTAAAHPVQEYRDAVPLGELAELVLGPGPVEPGPGHDRRPLGTGKELRRRLDPAGGI